MPYLSDAEDQQRGGLDLTLEVFLQSASMRQQGIPPAILSRSNSRDLYWTLAQMLAHHASNGCNLRPGDLLATGTVSGPDVAGEISARGCLLEVDHPRRESDYPAIGRAEKVPPGRRRSHPARALRT